MTKASLARQEPPLPAMTPPDLGRRQWLYGAVAGGAALAGVGLAWWNRPAGTEPEDGRPALWQLSFEVPGSKTALEMRTLAGKPLLLNFWATWCPPCVEEFPLLDRFYQENSANGWQVIGLAVDQLSAVETFLRRIPVRFPVALAGLAGIALSKTLGNQGGALPFTVVFGSAGQVLHRKTGRVSSQDLTQWSALR